MQRITPCLWFDDQAEEAARFYTSVFANSKIGAVTRYGAGGMRPEGMVMTVAFELDGQEFLALNGGPQFPFTDAISLVVNVDTQAELDAYWTKLCEGGREVQCGWLKDRFGVSWQIVPRVLAEMLRSTDAARTQRMVKAMMPMKKLDIDVLTRAFEGR